MTVPGTFRWTAGDLESAEDASHVPLLVADSFLVRDGGVVGLDLHRERFLRALGEPAVAALAGVELPTADRAEAFWDAAVAALPRSGSWFPRFELTLGHQGPEFRLRLRNAPQLGRSITLRTHSGADPRRAPSIKGPDLEVLLGVRAHVQRNGAGDAVLLSPEGHVVDCCTSALAWWRGDSLCVPHGDLPRVDSVTARLLLRLAASAGVSVHPERSRPSDLAGLEIWALNALHGIRVVEHWPNGSRATARPWRAAEWRARLGRLRRPLPRTDSQ